MTTDHEDERFSPDGPDGHIDPNDAEPIEGAAFDPGDADEAITPQADYVRRRDLREQRKREALASSATPAKSSATAVYQLPYGNIASNLVDLRKKLFRPGELTLGRTKSDRLWGWLGPLLVTLFGFVLRVWNLGYPHKLVFDETHYVKHAWTLLQIGYEAEWPKDYDSQFNVGKVMGFETKPAFIVHPQLGKWLIAIGMKFLGGDNPWGWRIMVCLFGTATIWLVARAGRHLFGSTKLGILAGFLFAIDGQAIVHARYALLDGFLVFFIVASFATFLLDRTDGRNRLAERVAARLDKGEEITGWGPFLGMRWWRLATGVLLGLTCAVKLSGIYFVAVWGLLMVIDDALARRAIGVKHWLRGGIIKDGLLAFFLVVPTTLLTYVATWFSWFTHSASYARTWAADNPGEGVTWLPDALNSLLHFHIEMFKSAADLIYPHPYGAHPAGWIIQLHPTVYLRDTFTGTDATCGAPSCIATIVDVGNPLIWWGATAAFLWLMIVWFDRLDWRFTAIMSGMVAGWVPWFFFAKRVVFTFYSIAFAPFMVFALVYVVALIVERWRDYPQSAQRRMTYLWTFAGVLVVLVSIFFYPVWTGIQLPQWLWFWHSWIPGWM